MAPRKTRTIDQQYYIHAPPKKVFRAITQPKWLKRWFCDAAELSLRKGGRFRVAWTNGPTHSGKLLEFTRGKSLTFGWSWEGFEDVGVTPFKLAVKRKGKGTLLTLTHRGFPKGERRIDLYAGAIWGWTYFAMNLKSVLESGTDLRTKYDG
jgi:uncharacterized protein YndB with AHSA1/START domain